MSKETDRLMEALREYGRHKYGCPLATLSRDDAEWHGAKCNCGFVDALKPVLKLEGGIMWDMRR